MRYIDGSRVFKMKVWALVCLNVLATGLILGWPFCEGFQQFRTGKILSTSRRMSWSDNGWNWGSAVGTAHNVAMSTRAGLGTKQKRTAWIENCSKGEIDVEEMKMVLALRFQRASREGKDGCGAGWNIMCDMADCKYEGGEDNLVKLKDDLCVLIDKLPGELTSLVRVDGDVSLGSVVGSALCGTDFLDSGL